MAFYFMNNDEDSFDFSTGRCLYPKGEGYDDKSGDLGYEFCEVTLHEIHSQELQ
jgi:hypothetical protein